MEPEENHEKGRCWPWARNHRGNPGSYVSINNGPLSGPLSEYDRYSSSFRPFRGLVISMLLRVIAASTWHDTVRYNSGV
jgi:hypothetical protein